MIKALIPLLFFISCSEKYQKSPYIEKRAFQSSEKKEVAPPLVMKRVRSQDKESFCHGQIFFSSNAEKITEASLKGLVRQTCPGSPYLLNATITRTWWTMLVYSRSCIEIVADCSPKNDSP